jgi:hypothetical protein
MAARYILYKSGYTRAITRPRQCTHTHTSMHALIHALACSLSLSLFYTHTHTQMYVILIGLTRRQCCRERASVLRYTYIASCIKIFPSNACVFQVIASLHGFRPKLYMHFSCFRCVLRTLRLLPFSSSSF